jgi:Txe/YoeB family toxin of Txe-Axe toxin-antitoxin module
MNEAADREGANLIQRRWRFNLWRDDRQPSESQIGTFCVKLTSIAVFLQLFTLGCTSNDDAKLPPLGTSQFTHAQELPAMDKSLDEFLVEYRELNKALDPYYFKIYAKADEAAPQPLSEAERVFFDLYGYWQAAIVNSGDTFGYVPFIIEHEADFVAVGAHETLKALTNLMPYYHEQQKLKSEIEKGAYSRRTKEERAAVENVAEDTIEFARLLLAYAEQNLTTPASE